MAILNQLKEKISAFIVWICNQFRHGTEIVKLSGEKNSVEGEIRRRYEELGRTIYESKGENMSACREICDRIDELSDRLEALNARDVQIRSRSRCPACGAVMSKKAKFCSACGAAMPEVAAKEAEPVQEKAENTEE